MFTPNVKPVQKSADSVIKRRINPLLGVVIIAATALIIGVLLIYGASGVRAKATIERTIAYGAAGSPGAIRDAPPPGVDLSEPPPNMGGAVRESP